jgi:hypothetical protein
VFSSCLFCCLSCCFCFCVCVWVRFPRDPVTAREEGTSVYCVMGSSISFTVVCFFDV